MSEFGPILDKLSGTRFKFQTENQSNNDLYNEKQRRAEQLFELSTGYKTVPANAHGPSRLDGFVVKEKQFRAGYEIKCRTNTFEQLMKYGSFILTKDKVDSCMLVCSTLCIPFIAICYSIPDDEIRYWFVSNDRGFFYNQYKIVDTKLLGKPETVYQFPFNQSFQ